jgi:hypothetical protein
VPRIGTDAYLVPLEQAMDGKGMVDLEHGSSFPECGLQTGRLLTSRPVPLFFVFNGYGEFAGSLAVMVPIVTKVRFCLPPRKCL